MGRTLLVIDDVWHSEQISPFLIGGRRCARLVTTRHAATVPGGQVPVARIAVGKLTAVQARALLTAELPPLPPAVLDDLLAVTMRWPLLVRLVNRVLAEHAHTGGDPDGTAVELVKRLRDSGPAALDNVGQQEAAGASIGAAVELLGNDGGDRLADLSIFPADTPIPVSLVTRVWSATAGLSELDARALCGRMARLALVTLTSPTGEHLTVHETIQAHSRTRLGEPERVQLHRALLDSVPAGAGGAWWTLPADQTYLGDHVVGHLILAGQAEQAVRLVLDRRWTEARLLRSGPASVLVDLHEAADSDAPGSEQARQLHRVLARSAHLLLPTEPPEAVADILADVLQADSPAGRTRLIRRWANWADDDPAHLRTLTGHRGAVAAVAAAPNGKWLASADASGAMYIWDRVTGAGLPGPPPLGVVTGLAVSPDGTALAVAGRTFLALWDVETAALLWQRRRWSWTNRGPVTLAFADDGRSLLVVGRGRVRRFDTASGRGRRSLAVPGHGRVLIAGTPDGDRFTVASSPAQQASRHLVSGYVYPGRVYLFEPGRRRQSHTFRGHSARVTSVAIDGSGRWLASAGAEGSLRIWDGPARREAGVLGGHDGAVRAVGFSGDGLRLASGGDDGTVRIWSPAEGRSLAVLTGHTGAVTTVVFGADGSWLASGGADGTLRIWSADSDRSGVVDGASAGRLSAWTRRRETTTQGLAFTPDGRSLVELTRPDLVVRSLTTLRITNELTEYGLGDCDPVITPDGRWLLAGVSATALVLDTATYAVARRLTVPDLIHGLAAGADSSWVAVAHVVQHPERRYARPYAETMPMDPVCQVPEGLPLG